MKLDPRILLLLITTVFIGGAGYGRLQYQINHQEFQINHLQKLTNDLDRRIDNHGLNWDGK